jgi:hypothetical protein
VALTVDQVLGVVAPSYVGDARVSAATSIATSTVAGYSCLVGDTRVRALAYLVAHLLCIGDRQQAAANAGGAGSVVVGGVTAQSAGQVSQSYGMLGSSSSEGAYTGDDVYRTTPGGMMWLALRDGLPCARAVGWAR